MIKFTSIFNILLTITIAGVTMFGNAQEAESKNPRYEMTVNRIDKDSKKTTELGKIVMELFPDKAPKHVANFDSLVNAKFYDGCAFHRVIAGFMIQGGDPNSKNKPRETWGMGAPGQTKVPAEFNDVKHVKGVISAARTQDPNSATSQFFIMHDTAKHLDGQYTAYGKVVSGIELVDVIVNLPKDARDNPLDKVEFKIVKIK